MFEGRKLVKSKSDTCDQYPLKTLQPHKLCGSVAEPSLPTSVRFFILFLRELCAICICLLQFAFCVCTHKKKQTWPFLPEICYSIVSAWSWYYHYLHYLGDAIYNFQACCIIITNECHNRHVCNSSSEGIKVSFLLKEIIYDKSPIFFLPVINTFFFGQNINSGTRIVT